VPVRERRVLHRVRHLDPDRVEPRARAPRVAPMTAGRKSASGTPRTRQSRASACRAKQQRLESAQVAGRDGLVGTATCVA
jgi:hypothetical protein